MSPQGRASMTVGAERVFRYAATPVVSLSNLHSAEVSVLTVKPAASNLVLLYG